jgi:hypothetical protein
MAALGEPSYQPEIFLIVTLSILEERECYGVSISKNIIITHKNVLQRECKTAIYRKSTENVKNGEVTWNKINCDIEVAKDSESEVVLLTLIDYKI